ncbi:MAG: DNA repair protein RecO [Burkholderiales bacterium]|nr:DNA repair protein RecO [Burkholderiales bacterium]
MTQRKSQEPEPAFVLHSYRYRETSLIVEAFTRHHGRVGLLAKGARRPKSAFRGNLLPFQPLLIRWGGRGDLHGLHSAEWQAGVPQLKGIGLMSGFYLNELLLKFLQRDDPHEGLFDLYATAVAALSTNSGIAATLRRFEKFLLGELGYALTLDREAGTNNPVDPSARYTYIIEKGPVRISSNDSVAIALSGKTLLDLASDNYEDALTLSQSKLLMRHLVGHYVGSRALHTRQLLVDLQQI